MPFLLAVLRERSSSTPKCYDKESNESMIRLRKKQEALLSSPLVNLSLKKTKKLLLKQSFIITIITIIIEAIFIIIIIIIIEAIFIIITRLYYC